MGQSIQEWIKGNLWKTAFKKIEGCLPQILLGPFLKTLTQILRKCPGHFLNVLYTFRLPPVSKGELTSFKMGHSPGHLRVTSQFRKLPKEKYHWHSRRRFTYSLEF